MATTWRLDQALQAPREELAYVGLLNPDGTGRPDAIAVLDVDPRSSSYTKVVGRVEMPGVGDEVHHLGWSACANKEPPRTPHSHQERRYLLVPGLKSSRIHVIDTGDDPTQPRIVKVIEAKELHEATGYSRPHAFHCGPDGIYASALGAPDGNGPGGVFVMDNDTFEPLGRWELDRGPQRLAYDFWWHPGHDAMITSEWGLPNMVESGLNPETLFSNGYGHRLHLWDLRGRKHLQALDLSKEHQMVLELTPAHKPSKAYGFVCAVVSTRDLSASIWLWYRENGMWAVKKVIEIPAEPADTDDLPPVLKGFGAVPPLVTDINLSLDDRFLYVSCWGTGELRQYDVSNPFEPRHTGSVRLGGIVRRSGHPAAGGALNGAPHMVEVSRDGKRVYFSNSLYSSWDEQFYPDGIRGWVVKADVSAADGGSFALDPDFFVGFRGERPHQIRLQGGDSSSDSFCHPS